MAVIALGGTKGGTGKSTLCCNLAAMRGLAGKRVVIYDTDKQRTAADWGDFRSDTGVKPRVKVESKWMQVRDGADLGAKGKALLEDIDEASELYDDVLVDGGGEDNPSLRFVMLATDTFLVPFAPSGPDIWALANVEEVYQTVSGMGRNNTMVPILFPANVSPMTSERKRIEQLIEQYPGFQFLQGVTIFHRVQYRHSFIDGLSVLEMPKPDPKARQELLALYKAAFGEHFVMKREALA